MKKETVISVFTILIVAILIGARVATHAHAEPSISGDGWGYLNRAFFIHEFRKLPPLHIQPVGYSIALSKIAFLGKEGLLHASVRIQQILDFAIILALACFSWLLSLKIQSQSIRKLFILLCFSFLLIQPFTAKLSNGLYTESSVMALCFLGIGLFSLFISKNFANRGIALMISVLGGSAMGLASTMRIDILALNIAFLLITTISFFLLGRPTMGRKGASFLFISLIIPLALLVAQFTHTGEVGFQSYSKKTYPIEFISWTGTWRADRREHSTYAWFSSNLDNLDTDLYPSKAFSSVEEKKEVESLFKSWKQHGYSDFVRTGFKDVVSKKRASQPATYYLLNPLYRMYHHWVNIEGADFYLSSFVVPAGLFSRSLVLFVFILRISVLLLFVYGSVAFSIKAVHKLKVYNLSDENSISKAPNVSNLVVGFSIIFVLMRTLELGVLSTLSAGGLMEPRYVTVAFPSVLAVAIYGASRLLDSPKKPLNA